jgi:carbohydrate kinase (thermoresistant glucokinase family)
MHGAMNSEEFINSFLACSALKQSCRARLQRHPDNVRFVYLKGDCDLIHQRLTNRHGHFMPAGLLANQFATLEEPQGVLTVIIDQSPEAIVTHIRQSLRLVCYSARRKC